MSKTLTTKDAYKFRHGAATAHQSPVSVLIGTFTSSSAMTERPRELGDFKGVGHFDAKF